jgi:hypothetical protein
MDSPAASYQPFKPAPWSTPRAKRRHKQQQIMLASIVCASVVLSLAAWITATYALKISTFMLIATLAVLLFSGLLVWAFSLTALMHKTAIQDNETPSINMLQDVPQAQDTQETAAVLVHATADAEAVLVSLREGVMQLEQQLLVLVQAPWLQTESKTAVRLKAAIGWWHEEVVLLLTRLSEGNMPNPELGYIVMEAQAQYALLAKLSGVAGLNEDTLGDAERQVIAILSLFEHLLLTND